MSTSVWCHRTIMLMLHVVCLLLTRDTISNASSSCAAAVSLSAPAQPLDAWTIIIIMLPEDIIACCLDMGQSGWSPINTAGPTELE